MPSKETIIENVGQYDALEIVDFIKAGVVDFDELCDEPSFAASKRKEVKKLLDQGNKEKDDWAAAKSSRDTNVLEAYLKNYPKGRYRDEARELIRDLENNIVDGDDSEIVSDDDEIYTTRSLRDDIVQRWAEGADEEALYEYILSKCRGNVKTEVLSLVREDPNVIPAGTLRRLCEGKVIKKKDLESVGINREFIKVMNDAMQLASFGIPEKLERISRTSTEVYFWGIPDSGKSCALGAILSTAYNGGVTQSMSMDNNCQGYGYMRRLSNIFRKKDEAVALPEKTATTSTYEMSFDLVDKGGLTHPITCIDLAGELMRCMYKHDARENMGDEDRQILDTMTDILVDNRTGNRKIHFFVLEYGAENREYDGLTQNVYIDAAMGYIERAGIFKKDTDAIFLMLTKVDRIKADGADRGEILQDYVRKNYKGFYNRLEKICRDNEINGGKVEIVPFSLGEVCMRYYCLFDDSAARSIVQLLIDHSKGFKGGRSGQWLRNFRS